MPSLDHRVIQWMSGHCATVSASALDAAGVSTPQRNRLVRAGIIERVVDGGYRFGGAEPDELTRAVPHCARLGLTSSSLDPRPGESGRSAAVPATDLCTSSVRPQANPVVSRGSGPIARPISSTTRSSCDPMGSASPVRLERSSTSPAIYPTMPWHQRSNGPSAARPARSATLRRLAERLNTQEDHGSVGFSGYSINVLQGGLGSPIGSGGSSTDSSPAR